jgi:tetratricopeptide (TPR) repeat protein
MSEEMNGMIRNTLPKSGNPLSRPALAMALALGAVTGGAMLSAPAMAAKPPAAPKLNLSKPFQAVAAPLSKAIDDAKVRADVVAAKAKVDAAQAALQAARGNTARTAASTARDAAVAELGATLAPQKTQLEGIASTVSTPDDRYTYGQLAVSLGGLAMDQSLQRRGLTWMIESNKVSAPDAARFQFFIGSIAFEQKDYAGARTALHAAVAGGYHDNDADALLADAYISDNQVPQGLALLKTAIDARKATGTPAPVNWYRRGLGAAYKAKLLDQTSDFSMGLVQNYPSNDNWAGAIAILREIGHYPAQETLDLMRLMGRTNSYAEERDYIEYIQAADARRSPGEVLKVIQAGVAAGKLNISDIFVAESRTVATARITADQASLPGLERDARLANASAVTAMAAGDAFLSYAEAAKAEALYTIALAKSGVDAPRVLTRLGIAQFDQGNYAGSQATFAKIDGPRKAIAQLWSIYAAQKARPAG